MSNMFAGRLKMENCANRDIRQRRRLGASNLKSFLMKIYDELRTIRLFEQGKDVACRRRVATTSLLEPAASKQTPSARRFVHHPPTAIILKTF